MVASWGAARKVSLSPAGTYMPFRSLTARREYVTENKEKMEVPDTFGPKSDDFAPQVSAVFDVRHQRLTSIFSLFSATYSNCSLRWHSKRHVSPGGGQARLSCS